MLQRTERNEEEKKKPHGRHIWCKRGSVLTHFLSRRVSLPSLSLFTFSSRYVLYLLLSFFLLSLRLRVPVPYVKVEHRPMRLYRQQKNKDENKKFSSCNSIWFHPGTFDPVEAAGWKNRWWIHHRRIWNANKTSFFSSFACCASLQISTSARIRNWRPNAWRTPSAATCRPTTRANANRVSKATERNNVSVIVTL